jgi:hypothetical protein
MQVNGAVNVKISPRSAMMVKRFPNLRIAKGLLAGGYEGLCRPGGEITLMGRMVPYPDFY